MPELDSIVQTADEVPADEVTRLGAYRLAGPRCQTAMLHSMAPSASLGQPNIFLSVFAHSA